MTFSSITQFALGDEEGQSRWLLEHFIEHDAINDALQEQFGVASTDFPIQKVNDIKEWLAAHQLISQSQWTLAGGGQSVDLESVDWNDENQMNDWFNIHASWHYQMRQALGL